MSLEAIAIRPAHRRTMTELVEARITLAHGVEGDFGGKPGRRQVTVLSTEAWHEACSDLGTDLSWLLRRANLLVRGPGLARTVGALLRIGDVVLEITGETTPCRRMDEQHPGLQKALEPDWRGGVCCKVRTAGTVRVGDCVGDCVEFDS